MRILALLVACLFAFQKSSEAGAIRLSFLQDDISLRDTTDLLVRSGCSQSNVENFRQVVRHYGKEPFIFDFGKFPRIANGFYDFSTTPELLSVFPHHLGNTRHSFDFNCMDMVIVTADNRLRTSLTPDEIFEPFLVSTATTNGDVMGIFTTPRDAFTAGYVPEYRKATEVFFPKSAQDQRICLTACLYRLYVLPTTITQENLKTLTMDVLRAAWRRETVQFPEQFEIVLVHTADVRNRLISTDHAGVLLSSNGGYTYLEKAGGRGPFVRLDFKHKSDLMPWLAAAFLSPKPSYHQRYATFNANSIVNLNSK